MVERYSSSTSVNNQLVQLKEEIQNIRISFLPKLNYIFTSQLNAAPDIAILTESQSLLSDNSLQLALLSGHMDLLQVKLIATDNFFKKHFQKVEGGIEHLNTGMMHLYNMIKKEHPPTAEQRKLFEGGNGGGGGSGSGTGEGNEDPSTHKSKYVEDSSRKGEKKARDPEKDKGSDKGCVKDKGKQVISYEDNYY